MQVHAPENNYNDGDNNNNDVFNNRGNNDDGKSTNSDNFIDNIVSAIVIVGNMVFGELLRFRWSI